jgi:hypothetical protein
MKLFVISFPKPSFGQLSTAPGQPEQNSKVTCKQ